MLWRFRNIVSITFVRWRTWLAHFGLLTYTCYVYELSVALFIVDESKHVRGVGSPHLLHSKHMPFIPVYSIILTLSSSISHLHNKLPISISISPYLYLSRSLYLYSLSLWVCVCVCVSVWGWVCVSVCVCVCLHSRTLCVLLDPILEWLIVL